MGIEYVIQGLDGYHDWETYEAFPTYDDAAIAFYGAEYDGIHNTERRLVTIIVHAVGERRQS
mgnify:CR=1 FL=1